MVRIYWTFHFLSSSSSPLIIIIGSHWSTTSKLKPTSSFFISRIKTLCKTFLFFFNPNESPQQWPSELAPNTFSPPFFPSLYCFSYSAAPLRSPMTLITAAPLRATGKSRRLPNSTSPHFYTIIIDGIVRDTFRLTTSADPNLPLSRLIHATESRNGLFRQVQTLYTIEAFLLLFF